MVEITDEYFDPETIKTILKTPFQTFVQKYVTKLLLKGESMRGDLEVLMEKLKFMKQYFPQDYDNLHNEIKQNSWMWNDEYCYDRFDDDDDDRKNTYQGWLNTPRCLCLLKF